MERVSPVVIQAMIRRRRSHRCRLVVLRTIAVVVGPAWPAASARLQPSSLLLRGSAEWFCSYAHKRGVARTGHLIDPALGLRGVHGSSRSHGERKT